MSRPDDEDRWESEGGAPRMSTPWSDLDHDVLADIQAVDKRLREHTYLDWAEEQQRTLAETRGDNEPCYDHHGDYRTRIPHWHVGTP